MIGVGAFTTGIGAGAFLGNAVIDPPPPEPPTVLVPNATILKFPYGALGLPKDDPLLLAFLSSATATGENGSLTATPNTSFLPDPIPPGEYTISFTATDANGTTTENATLTILEASKMGQAKVIVNNLNLAQGEFPEIERKALFIGEGPENVGSLIAINTQSDLDNLLGQADSELKRNVEAAKLNGGESWLAYAMPQNNGYDWQTAVDQAMLTISPELIILCTPATNAAQLNAMQAKAVEIATSMARRVAIITATPGINPATQTWADYATAQAAITSGVAADRVGAVPLLHTNELGAVAGRLCNHAVTVADSPMRVATGTMLGLGDTPTDSAGVPLPSATLSTLVDNRLSCIQRYPDLPGTYFGDLSLLDVPGGDYQVIENLRVVDKVARAVRLLAIHRVANRSFNNTVASIQSNITYFSRPLREMSHTVKIAGEVFPGEIKPPKDDAITIVWKSLISVEIYIKVQPHNSPKEITVNLVLDLSGQI